MKLLNKALEDVTFIRLIYLVWAIPFGILLLWMLTEIDYFTSPPLLLVIPALDFIVCAFLLYLASQSEHKTPMQFDYINPAFWILFFLATLIAMPAWLLIKGFRSD